MTKYILASMASLMLLATPAAVMAQSGNGTDMGSSDKMKGPPNANGMQTDNSSGTTSGRSESSGSSNGAASATSTGADKH